MTCFICDGPATSIDSDSDYQERVCLECGHYKLSRTAIDVLAANNWKLDVELARRWLAMQQGIGLVPLIDSNRAVSLIRS